MPTYISLMKFTDQGIRDIKDAPKQVEEAIKTLESMGGKLIGFYTALGEYDYVLIADVPADGLALAFVLGLGSRGNVRTTTLRAFPQEEFMEIVKDLP
jgi:uncharacterized protein with GYD domain